MVVALPLLNLPSVVFDRVLQSFTFEELFDLSQCSKLTFNLVKNFGLGRPTIMIISIKESVSVSVYCRRTSQGANWIFYHDRDPRIMDLENPKTCRISGCGPMDFCFVVETRMGTDYGCVSGHSVQEVLKFGLYLRSLFNGFVSMIDVKCDQRNYLDALLSIDVYRTMRKLRVDRGVVSHAEMRKILSGFVMEHMLLVCTTKPNFTFDQPIRCDSFCAIRGFWVTRQMLQNLDCKKGTVYDSSLNNVDLNEYLKTWLDGSNTKLEYIEVTNDETELEMAKIVEGIPHIPGVPKRPGATGYQAFGDPVFYENGVDLKRESDGMLATVVTFKDRMNHDHFLFVVWHVPDPNLVVVVNE